MTNRPLIAAGVDLGSNSFRLLVARRDGRRLETLAKESATVRLGQDLLKNKALSPAAIGRALQVLTSFRATMAACQPQLSQACGTAALRAAANSAQFLLEAKKALGLEIEVLSGQEEALLCLAGALSAFKQPPAAPLLLADVGGGSTELLLQTAAAAVRIASLPLGAVGLTERFPAGSPPSSRQVQALTGHIGSTLQAPLQAWLAGPPRHPIPTVMATGGTATALAALDLELDRYDETVVQGHVLSKSRLDQLCRRLLALPPAKRLLLPGLDKGRGDIILAGAKIYQVLLELSGARQIIVSDAGLLEGIVLREAGAPGREG